jgi:hypothetical protein
MFRLGTGIGCTTSAVRLRKVCLGSITLMDGRKECGMGSLGRVGRAHSYIHASYYILRKSFSPHFIVLIIFTLHKQGFRGSERTSNNNNSSSSKRWFPRKYVVTEACICCHIGGKKSCILGNMHERMGDKRGLGIGECRSVRVMFIFIDGWGLADGRKALDR